MATNSAIESTITSGFACCLKEASQFLHCWIKKKTKDKHLCQFRLSSMGNQHYVLLLSLLSVILLLAAFYNQQIGSYCCCCCYLEYSLWVSNYLSLKATAIVMLLSFIRVSTASSIVVIPIPVLTREKMILYKTRIQPSVTLHWALLALSNQRWHSRCWYHRDSFQLIAVHCCCSYSCWAANGRARVEVIRMKAAKRTQMPVQRSKMTSRNTIK